MAASQEVRQIRREEETTVPSKFHWLTFRADVPSRANSCNTTATSDIGSGQESSHTSSRLTFMLPRPVGTGISITYQWVPLGQCSCRVPRLARIFRPV